MRRSLRSLALVALLLTVLPGASWADNPQKFKDYFNQTNMTTAALGVVGFHPTVNGTTDNTGITVVASGPKTVDWFQIYNAASNTVTVRIYTKLSPGWGGVYGSSKFIQVYVQSNDTYTLEGVPVYAWDLQTTPASNWVTFTGAR